MACSLNWHWSLWIFKSWRDPLFPRQPDFLIHFMINYYGLHLHLYHYMKSFLQECKKERIPFTQFFSQQLMCLGCNAASTYSLIGLLVLRRDYSQRELFKHITLLSSCSYEAKSNRSWTTAAAVSWVTAEVELRIASNECFTPTHDHEANVKGGQDLMSTERMQHITTKVKKMKHNHFILC